MNPTIETLVVAVGFCCIAVLCPWPAQADGTSPDDESSMGVVDAMELGFEKVEGDKSADKQEEQPARDEPEPDRAKPAPSLAEARQTDKPSGRYTGLWRTLNGIAGTAEDVAVQALVSTMPATTAGSAGRQFGFPGQRQAKQTAQDRQQTAVKPKAPDVTTLIGRPGMAKIIETDGTVQTLTARDMTFMNQPGFRMSQMPSASRQWKPRTEQMSESAPQAGKQEEAKEDSGESSEEEPAKEGEEKEGEEKGGSKEEASGEGKEKQPEDSEKTGDSAAKEDGASTAKKSDEEEKPKKEDLPAKKQDAERIKRIRATGAWIYDKEGNPVSNEELDKRLESGDIAGLKAVDAITMQGFSTKDTYEISEEDGGKSEQTTGEE